MTSNKPPKSTLPANFQAWFDNKGWSVRSYQKKMLSAFKKKQSTLLIAPTGAGKTLSGFLPSLIDLAAKHASSKSANKIGLHTLYISPLKALTADIQRNLNQPIDDLDLAITVAARTGDTTPYQRQKQRKNPPNILLITPERMQSVNC